MRMDATGSTRAKDHIDAFASLLPTGLVRGITKWQRQPVVAATIHGYVDVF